jgi:transcriptional regulator with XRE-family HTH domain
VDFARGDRNDPAVPNPSSRRQDPALVAVGRAIKDLRQSKQMSQEQLALRAGVNRSYMGDVERGDNAPALLTLIKIAHALDVTAGELLIIAAL